MATLKSIATGSIRLPIIVILGSTGVGKSKLGIELAKKVGGEVISADSMQVYKGLDIITAKVTAAEQRECKHHMINIVSPLENFSVVQFRNIALPIISDISARGKIPIIVGGTNYYIESLLWDILVPQKRLDDSESEGTEARYQETFQTKDTVAEDVTKEPLSCFKEMVDDPKIGFKRSQNYVNLESAEKNSGQAGISSDIASLNNQEYKRLKMIDPIAASRVHPNDNRKVKRKLQIAEALGKTPTQVFVEQQQQEGSDHLGGPLRFTNALVFWLCSDQSILDERISKRVEEMLNAGLVAEISDFYEEYKKNVLSSKKDSEPYTEGIFQAIGFKEFHNFLTCEKSDEKSHQKKLQDCINALKRVTIRYSKKQKAWIQNRFLKRPQQSSPDLYKLDASCIDKWYDTVMRPALEAAETFLCGKELTLKPVPRIFREPNESAHRQYICKICYNKLIVGDSTWKAHCKSRKHQKIAAKQRKLQANCYSNTKSIE